MYSLIYQGLSWLFYVLLSIYFFKIVFFFMHSFEQFKYFLKFHFYLCIVFSVSLCVAFLVIASVYRCMCIYVFLCTYDLQSAGVSILPFQVKHRNFTSLYIFVPSPTYNCLKYFLYVHGSANIIQKTHEKDSPLYFPMFVLSLLFFLPSRCFRIPSFIIFFLFRERPLAIIFAQMC